MSSYGYIYPAPIINPMKLNYKKKRQVLIDAKCICVCVRVAQTHTERNGEKRRERERKDKKTKLN